MKRLILPALARRTQAWRASVLPALLLLLASSAVFSAQAATAGKAAPAPLAHTRGTETLKAPAEVELEEQVRKDRNAVRRARYALRKAERENDSAAAAQASKYLSIAKERHKRSRERLKGAVRSGEASSRYRNFKRLIREDQNALRRLRRQLKKARQKDDEEAVARIEERMRKAKGRLKDRRMDLRRHLRDCGVPKAGDGERGHGRR